MYTSKAFHPAPRSVPVGGGGTSLSHPAAAAAAAVARVFRGEGLLRVRAVLLQVVADLLQRLTVATTVTTAAAVAAAALGKPV